MDREEVEIRASISVLDQIIENTSERIEREIEHSYRNIYSLEAVIPPELGELIEHLRTLPIIEEPEEETEGGSSFFSEDI